jgi:microcompartment protein CcmK/EutM
MILARVTGSVVSTQKNEELEGNRLLVIQPVDLKDNPVGSCFVALDVVDAGEGDLVLVIDEGGSARILMGNDKMPLRNVVIGVVDDFHVEEELL